MMSTNNNKKTLRQFMLRVKWVLRSMSPVGISGAMCPEMVSWSLQYLTEGLKFFQVALSLEAMLLVGHNQILTYFILSHK